MRAWARLLMHAHFHEGVIVAAVVSSVKKKRPSRAILKQQPHTAHGRPQINPPFNTFGRKPSSSRILRKQSAVARCASCAPIPTKWPRRKNTTPPVEV